MKHPISYRIITAEEAASEIPHGSTVGFSGFTPAGAAKVIPKAIARRAREEHERGNPYQIGVVTGASTGDSLDGELTRAEAISFRTPYQSDRYLRGAINTGKIRFFDMHLSMLSQTIRYGFLGDLTYAVVEAASISLDGHIVPTTSVGITDTLCHVADRILIEVNTWHHPDLIGIHDIYQPKDPPHRREIPIYSCRDRAGSETIKVDPGKIVGVVYNEAPDETTAFKKSDAVTQKIGANVADFLSAEIRKGKLPSNFLPIQSGVGNIANAVLGALGENPEIPSFEMYSEVIQDNVIQLVTEGKITFASGTSLTLSPGLLESVQSELSYFKKHIVLRPQEITNHPEVIRRLGIISVNTALELDIWGNVNSTHVMGSDLMNGIGGSGDFTRNAYISLFTCPSTAKDGAISTIVPLVSHQDHNEHSVQVVVTEHGVADLRCLDPTHRARAIIDQCAAPEYRNILHAYHEKAQKGHTPQSLKNAFAMHQAYLDQKDMHTVKWE